MQLIVYASLELSRSFRSASASSAAEFCGDTSRTAPVATFAMLSAAVCTISTAAAAISPPASMAPAATSVPTAMAADTGFVTPALPARRPDRFCCCAPGLEAVRFAAVGAWLRFVDEVAFAADLAGLRFAEEAAFEVDLAELRFADVVAFEADFAGPRLADKVVFEADFAGP